MECMSINETLKKVLKYYPACPFTTHNIVGLYKDEGYDATDTYITIIVSIHLAILYKQKYLKKVDTIRMDCASHHVYMVRQ